MRHARIWIVALGRKDQHQSQQVETIYMLILSCSPKSPHSVVLNQDEEPEWEGVIQTKKSPCRAGWFHFFREILLGTSPGCIINDASNLGNSGSELAISCEDISRIMHPKDRMHILPFTSTKEKVEYPDHGGQWAFQFIQNKIAATAFTDADYPFIFFHSWTYICFLYIYDYKCCLSIWAFVCTDRGANTSFYKDITSLVILELSSSLPGRMRRSYQIWAVAMRILPRSRCTNWGSSFGLIERMWKGNNQIMAQDVHWNPW